MNKLFFDIFGVVVALLMSIIISAIATAVIVLMTFLFIYGLGEIIGHDGENHFADSWDETLLIMMIGFAFVIVFYNVVKDVFPLVFGFIRRRYLGESDSGFP